MHLYLVLGILQLEQGFGNSILDKFVLKWNVWDKKKKKILSLIVKLVFDYYYNLHIIVVLDIIKCSGYAFHCMVNCVD